MPTIHGFVEPETGRRGWWPSGHHDRSSPKGDLTGAAVTGAIAAFLVSGLFDNILEAPRVATLFFLICFCGLIGYDADHAASSSTASASHS